MRTLRFAKRNFLEIVRDPLSLIFCLGFPIALMLIFQLITKSLPAEAVESVPQFAINQLTLALVFFGFTFITLFSGILVSKDRGTSFLARIKTSPMKSIDFIAGYALPMIPIALIQMIICIICGLIFGFNLTGNIFMAALALFPSALLFISTGLIFGSLVNDKAVGGISSLIINIAGIMGGIFMPLDSMTGAFKDIAYALPFANGVKAATCANTGDFSAMGQPLLIVSIYAIVIFVLAIFVFKRRLKGDHL